MTGGELWLEYDTEVVCRFAPVILGNKALTRIYK